MEIWRRVGVVGWVVGSEIDSSPEKTTLKNAALLELTNFETQKYYQNEPKSNGFYSRNNLSKIKYGTYIISLDEYEPIGTHWIAL